METWKEYTCFQGHQIIGGITCSKYDRNRESMQKDHSVEDLIAPLCVCV